MTNSELTQALEESKAQNIKLATALLEADKTAKANLKKAKASTVDYSMLSTLDIAKDITSKAVTTVVAVTDVLTASANLATEYIDTISIANKATLESDIRVQVTKNLIKSSKLMESVSDDSIEAKVDAAMAKVAHLL